MSDSTEIDYEISIADIIRTLWFRRAFIVVVSVLAGGLAVAYSGYRLLTSSPMVTYYISLRNIENQRYPNGAVFSPQDLLSPQILSEVQSSLNLQQVGGLRQAITITSDSPTSAGIALKYQQKLATRGLTQNEIDAINQSYMQELNAASEFYLRIDIDYASLDLSSEMGKSIARALPETWSKVYSTQFRVYTDRRLADMRTGTKVPDLNDDGAFITALLQLNVMKNGLNTIIEDNRYSVFQTPSGPSASDLLNDIRDFEKTLFFPLRYASYSEDDFVAASYIKGLQFESEELQRRIDAVDRGIGKIHDMQPKNESEVRQATGMLSERDVLQLGESALSPIVDLANRANFANFIQQMVNDRTQLEFRLSTLKAEIDTMSSGQSVPIKPEVVALATAQLQQIVNDYRNLVSLIEKQSVSTAGRFFKPYLGPSTPNLLVSKRYLLGIFLAGFVGFVFASILVLGQSAIAGLRK